MDESRGGLFRRRSTTGRREHRTVIKHNDEEFARVSAMAELHGVSRARLYERALLAGDVVAASKLSSLASEVRIAQRIIANAANNLNQAAHVANATGEVRADEIVVAADEVLVQAQQIRAILARIPGAELFLSDPPQAVDGER